MKTKWAVVVFAVLLGALVVASPAAAQNTTDGNVTDGNVTDGNTTDGNESANETVELAFGQQISVIVSAQQAEMESEIEDGAFTYTFERGNKSEAVKQRLRDIHERILEFKREKAELREEYRNGNLSKQEYLARKTRLSVKANATNESVSDVSNKTEEMNESERAQVNFTAIELLKNEARNMTGPEVARIAHTIAGKAPAHAGPPAWAGPPEADGNESRGPPADVGDGRPDDVGPPDRNESDRGGPPSGVGPGDGAGPDDRGQGPDERGSEGSGDDGGPPGGGGGPPSDVGGGPPGGAGGGPP